MLYSIFNKRGALLILGVSIFIWTFFKITTATSVETMFEVDMLSMIYFVYTIIVTATCWQVSVYFYNFYTSKYPVEFLRPRILWKYFATNIPIVGIILLFSTYGIIYYIEDWVGCKYDTPKDVKLLSDWLKGLMFGVLINIGFVAFHFWKTTQQSEIIQQKIMKENLAYKYETLKSHINPHFLFNSFSVLTSIVHQNPDLASDFIAQLSKIYRYVLDNKDKEMMPVEMELEFLSSYLYLMKIRHDRGIDVTYDVKIEKDIFNIPALSLQMLAENAAKHNSFSDTAPLNLEVYTENGEFLVIRNNLKARHVENSTGTGLKNIDERYKLLSNKSLIVEKDERFFTVKLPLIKKA